MTDPPVVVVKAEPLDEVVVVEPVVEPVDEVVAEAAVVAEVAVQVNQANLELVVEVEQVAAVAEQVVVEVEQVVVDVAAKVAVQVNQANLELAVAVELVVEAAEVDEFELAEGAATSFLPSEPHSIESSRKDPSKTRSRPNASQKRTPFDRRPLIQPQTRFQFWNRVSDLLKRPEVSPRCENSACSALSAFPRASTNAVLLQFASEFPRKYKRRDRKARRGPQSGVQKGLRNSSDARGDG